MNHRDLHPNSDGLWIVITDFNGFDQTKLCLQALRLSDVHGFTTLVVDHGTDAETRNALARDYPEVIRLAGSPELWWTGATNLGIRCALAHGATAVMLLNNDCYVTPETVGILLGLGRSHPSAIIAAIQRDWKTERMMSISPRSCFLLGFPTISGPKSITPAMDSRDLEAVKLISGGRGVLLPNFVLARLGLFDADALPHYGADHDFYLRARRLGIPLYVATGAFVDIDGSHTTTADRPETLSWGAFLSTLRDTRSHRNLRDVAALFRKHYPIPWLYPVGVALYTGRYLVVYLVKRGGYLLALRRRKRCSKMRGTP